jgi:hypothetical protein
LACDASPYQRKVAKIGVLLQQKLKLAFKVVYATIILLYIVPSFKHMTSPRCMHRQWHIKNSKLMGKHK